MELNHSNTSKNEDDQQEYTGHQYNLSQDPSNDRALNLNLSIGYNAERIGSVHNLTSGKSKKEIFIPAAHTGVIYNYETGEQKLLQGHCNQITASCCIYDSQNDKRWLVTADSGKNSMIVIWDCDTGKNFKSIFKIPSDEIVSMDISNDCSFIATLANKHKESINENGDVMKGEVISQKITLWEWRFKTEQIFISDFFDNDGEVFNLIRFNPNQEKSEIELIIQGQSKILFWNINPMIPDACRPYFPIKSKGDKRINKDNKKEKDRKRKEKDEKEGKEKEGKEGKDESDNEKERIKEKTSKNKIEYTQSTFLNGCSMAITGTTAGYVIVWDICEALCKEDENKTDRRKIKTVQLLKYKKDLISDKDIINILMNYQSYIVVGSGDGAIKFYEYNFIIVRWFENISWLVTGISFDLTDVDLELDEEVESNEQSNTKFKCIPFITTDISASIKRISNSNNTYLNYNDETIQIHEIYRGFESNIVSFAIHPRQALIAVATDGNSVYKKEKKKKESVIREKKIDFRPYIQVFPFPDTMKFIKEENKRKEDEKIRKRNENKKVDKEKHMINSKEKELLGKEKDDYMKESQYKVYFDMTPTVIEFSTGGDFLVVGTLDGKLIFLDPYDLSKSPFPSPILQIKDITDKDDVNEKVNDIIFSSDKKHFAATDISGRIALFRYGNPYSSNENERKEWTIVGRYQFSSQINSFCFNESGNRVYCINKDRHAYEFELISNSKYESTKLPIPKGSKIENDCDLNYIIMSPNLSSTSNQGNTRENFIIANSEYKLRLLFMNTKEGSNEHFIVKQTSLGPTYGKPICKLRVVPGVDKDKRMLAFSTESKIFGLLYLPLDGNPYRMMGVIGHPGRIQEMKTSKNLDFIFTTGGTDYVINVWKHNVNPLQETVSTGGEGIAPHLTLLEGGKEGLMYQEMINFFYYTQIKSKDENTTKQRVLDKTVSKEHIYGLMTAMGYYPSNTELGYILNEIKYSKDKDNEKQLENNFNFEMFVKLYINHRPYKDIEYEKLDKAFKKIKKAVDNSSNGILREKFIELIKEHGDKMDEKQISECLEVLIGDGNIRNLSEVITSEYLYKDVLKFEESVEDETQ